MASLALRWWQERKAKRVTIRLPSLDADGDAVLAEAKEVIFADKGEFGLYLECSDLCGLLDNKGRMLSFYRELVDGEEYAGILKCSSGAVNSFDRDSSVTQELGEALVSVVAAEEHVSEADVEVLPPEALDIYDVSDPKRPVLVLGMDAAVKVKKTDQDVVYVASHESKVKDFRAVEDLKFDIDSLEKYMEDPERYPATQYYQNVGSFKKALYAEHYAFTKPQEITRFKTRCSQSNVMLVKQGGSRLVKASASLCRSGFMA